MKLLVIGKEGRLAHYSTPEQMHLVDIVYANRDSSEDEILAVGRDADFILVDAITPVSARVINAMPNLKMIHSEGVAYNRIDVDAAHARGVFVCNCRAMNADAVAEHTVLLMLGLIKDVVNGDRAVREGRQIQVKEGYMQRGDLLELRDLHVGLVGFGSIAQSTARLLQAFGTRVSYYKHNNEEHPPAQTYGASFLPLDELLAASDIVSMHVPVTAETQRMANASFFAKMKQGAYFVNTARGELVEPRALLDALASGHLAGAGLDTIEGEPVQPDNVYLQADEATERKILFSCHIAGITSSSFKRGYEMVWSDIQKVMAGEEPDHQVR